MTDSLSTEASLQKSKVRIVTTVGGTIARERQGAEQLRAEARLIRQAIATAQSELDHANYTARNASLRDWCARGELAASRLTNEAASATWQQSAVEAPDQKMAKTGYGVVTIERYKQLASGDYEPTESEYAKTLDVLGPFCAGQIPVYEDVDPADNITGRLVAAVWNWESEARQRVDMIRPLKLEGLQANSAMMSRQAWMSVARTGTRSLFVGFLAWTCPSGNVSCCEVLGRSLMGTIMADYIGAVDGEMAYGLQPWVDDVGSALARLAATAPGELYALALSYATIAGAKHTVAEKTGGHEKPYNGSGDADDDDDDDDDDLLWAVRWTDGAGTPCLRHYRRAWQARWSGEKNFERFSWAFPSVFVFNDLCDALADVKVGEAMNSVLWTAEARNRGATGALGRVYGDFVMAMESLVMAKESRRNHEQLASCVRAFCVGAIMYDALPRYCGATEKTRIAESDGMPDVVAIVVRGPGGLSRSWKHRARRVVTWPEFTGIAGSAREQLRQYVAADTIRHVDGELAILRSAYMGRQARVVQRVMFELYTCGCELLKTEGELTVTWVLAEIFYCWHVECCALTRWVQHVDRVLEIGSYCPVTLHKLI
ncbi:hypothetical protein NOR_03940 [Metarhizium rileyi]|uniref:Uncharacterized protein n=1 Tax=Metarhizium rileyi (strain RCEF 4871) TaxID=1649241 RepID=A0A167ENT8_METRR|nr:hypothetical protein NOR_03940 [Metarhizium rileyi RCEF 4871]